MENNSTALSVFILLAPICVVWIFKRFGNHNNAVAPTAIETKALETEKAKKPPRKLPFTDFSDECLRADLEKIWQREVSKLPVHTDLPRLSKRIDVTLGDHEYGVTGLPDFEMPLTDSMIPSVYRILTTTSSALEDEPTRSQIKNNFLTTFNVSDAEAKGEDKSRTIPDFDVAGTLSKYLATLDDNATIRALKCCNQSFLFPAVIRLKFLITNNPDSNEQDMSYKDLRGGWRIQVDIADDQVRVIHKKWEQSFREDSFQFLWELEVKFDRMVTVLESATVRIRQVKFGEEDTTERREQWDKLTKLHVILPLLAFECVLNALILFKVPYTEIDWIAYMQEVAGVFVDKELDYSKLRGDTGPLVYPAGFVYIYGALYWLTDRGADIFSAQLLFAAIYMIFTAVVFDIYRRSAVTPPWALVLLCLSKRIHSIFVLRLFNDCIAMLLLYCAVLLFIKKRWSWGCFVFSLAVSVKMNVLLFAPGLLLLLLKRFGVWGTIPKLAICASLQVILGLPFLLTYPVSYFHGSFDFGRQFFYIWTVNLKFLPEDIFLDKRLALGLLLCHVTALVVFLFVRWCRWEGGVVKSVREGYEPTAEHIVTVLFTSNFIGIVFARSLHFQFYSWYFHTLPHLLWCTDLPTPIRLIIMFLIEIVWNVFPSRAWSSSILATCHLIILVSLLMKPLKPTGLPLKTLEKRL
ncbi:hypothetical protein PROFUN_09337 [Planoprotostelium fungivorum]|uniref:dolichyl-P-Man:Man5GlcNAc2-PP-dolichol alpha-1,3-mannosyltransferase n=1 Tax=Planoprotostelium fungivorum TaxID=1890364 RepID=A0A2P6NHB1_9EUKA|nr:hypothetical protein PROFUN_09337 [Planoprotostelium fungivorum]